MTDGVSGKTVMVRAAGCQPSSSIVRAAGSRLDGWFDKRTILLGFAAAVLSLAASMAVGEVVAGVFGAGLALLMLSIAAVDAKIYLIPDQLNAAGVLLGLANALVLGHGDPTWPSEAALRALVVAGAFLGLRALYLGLRRRHGIGLGDVKLAAVAGAWLDWSIVPIAIELAALGALTVFGFRRFVLGKPMSHNARLPFGLFFAPAIWGCWLLQTALANAG